MSKDKRFNILSPDILSFGNIRAANLTYSTVLLAAILSLSLSESSRSTKLYII